jgi:hypothetical protein
MKVGYLKAAHDARKSIEYPDNRAMSLSLEGRGCIAIKPGELMWPEMGQDFRSGGDGNMQRTARTDH